MSTEDRLSCGVVTDGLHMYRRQRNGYWRTEVTAPAPPHRCEMPTPPEGFQVGSEWECLSCNMVWQLRWINDGSQYPGDRALVNHPSNTGPDGSTWVAFGRLNRRIWKRLGHRI